MDLGEMRTRLRRELKDEDAANYRWTDDELDRHIARAVAEAVREVDADLILVGLAGSAWIESGRQAGLRVASEVFADRALNPDGSLVNFQQRDHHMTIGFVHAVRPFLIGTTY